MVVGRFDHPAEWPALHRARTGPPPADPAALPQWIHLQHVPTQHGKALTGALDKVMRRHVGPTERWLGVSGEAHLGKTQTITAALLDLAMRSDVGWQQRRRSGYAYIPCVYVCAQPNHHVKGLLGAVATFCGIPWRTSDSEQALHERLTEVLPELGTRVIAVDDAQFYRRVSPTVSRTTDSLRNLLRLPAPIVFVGINLEGSALLWDPGMNNDTVRQLRRRHDFLPVGRLAGPSGVSEVRRMLAHFGRRMREIPDMTTPGLDDGKVVSALATCCEGRPGTILETLKHAATVAAGTDRVLSADVIREALPGPAHRTPPGVTA